MLVMGLYMNILKLVYQNVHTHYLIVGMKIPTHKDIPVPPHNATRVCTFEKNFNLTEWRNRA